MPDTSQLLRDLAVEAGKNASPRFMAEVVRKLTCPEHNGAQLTVNLTECQHPDVAKDRILAILQEHTWPEFAKRVSFVP